MTQALRALALLLLAASVAITSACEGEQASSEGPPVSPAVSLSPTAAPTTSPADRVASAEGHYLSELEPELAESIRTQPWFQGMDAEHLSLIGAILETEQAAGPRGEKESVAAAFSYATQQPWYTDGFDAGEALGLSGVFDTYTVSLEDFRLPQIGPFLASTIEHQLMIPVELPESGTIVVLVSADDGEVGRRALELATFWLPEVERITGAFPYTFLHIIVTDLPEVFAGLSFDEIIAISPDYILDWVVIHELTHSSLYGLFPIWFEEGYAYYMHHLLTESVETGVQEFSAGLTELGVDPRLDVGPRGGHEHQRFIEEARGFLFIEGLVEINGVDAVVETIRALRTKTFTDQDLVKQLARTDDPNEEAALRAYVCKNVVGTIHDYCN